MKGVLIIIYEFLRFFLISIPVFCIVSVLAILLVLFKATYKKVRPLFKTSQ
jgi:hypothetical protein